MSRLWKLVLFSNSLAYLSAVLWYRERIKLLEEHIEYLEKTLELYQEEEERLDD